MASARTSGDQSTMNPPSSDHKNASLADLLGRFIKNCFLLVARFYVMCFLIAYEWTVKILTGALKPLEPIATQVKKVPKKDISLEGIFYQFLRLQFIALLYVTPFVRGAASYFINPLIRLRDWAVEFVEGDAKTSRKVDSLAQD